MKTLLNLLLKGAAKLAVLAADHPDTAIKVVTAIAKKAKGAPK